jgi:hypothetical protein
VPVSNFDRHTVAPEVLRRLGELGLDLELPDIYEV